MFFLEENSRSFAFCSAAPRFFTFGLILSSSPGAEKVENRAVCFHALFQFREQHVENMAELVGLFRPGAEAVRSAASRKRLFKDKILLVEQLVRRRGRDDERRIPALRDKTQDVEGLEIIRLDALRIHQREQHREGRSGNASAAEGKSRAGRRGGQDGTAAGHDADLFLKASVALQHGVEQHQIGAEIEYITDMARIMEYGIMSTPALMIDDKIVSMGRVLKTKDVLKYL